MPLLRNKFQPYFPDPDSPNKYQCGPEKYCWPVQGGDRVLTQFYQTPCNANLVCDPDFSDYTLGPELLTNPSFTGNANGWLESGDTPITTTTPIWQWVVGDRIELIPASSAPVNGAYQYILGLNSNSYYRITVDFEILQGYVSSIRLATYDSLAFFTSGFYEFIVPTGTITSNIFEFDPYTTFEGYLDSASVKEVTFNCWDLNNSWIVGTGSVSHILNTVGDLVDISPNYINAGGYYKASVTISEYVSGSVDFYVSDVLVGTISANGVYEYYVNPTLNGTIKFTPTSDFVGSISNPIVYELKTDYALELIDSNGNIFDVSDSINYYQDYVTVDLDLNDYELADGCYNLNMYDYCVVTSDNLAQDPSFVDGYTYWTRNNAPAQYDDTGDQMKFIFDPFGQGFTDYVTNGDFSGGATGWTLGANWSVVGGKAVHTPGSTAALSQTMTLPTPGIGTNYSYYVGFTINNWTVGSVTVKLGNAVNGTSYTWKGNDTMIQVYVPRQSGSVDITFTPTSTFDGQIDDIAVVLTSGHTAFPILTNVAQPLFTPGTYQTEWEIIGSSDPNISVRTNILGATPLTTYESTVGVQSFTQSYALTGGNIQIVANFSKTDPNYLQVNYVAGDITVDNINVQKVEPFEATYVSECLNYSSNPIPRTKMIIGYCDQNALGFDFVNTGFKLMHRAEIRSLNPNYPSATEIMKSGRGNDRTVYGELQKYWQVTTDFASETFHDTMAAILICDHLEMGDTEGTVTEYSPLPEEYSPNWNGEGAYSLATATFQVRVKENGQKFNRHT